jgi:outer membrane cobalamin receptor
MVRFWIVAVLWSMVSASAFAGTVSGTVVEQKSREAVVGATVALYKDSLAPGQKAVRGAYTNRYGYYSIGKVPPGRYAVVVSFVGYTSTVTAVVIGADTSDVRLDVELAPKATEGKEVVVTAERSASALERQSTVTITPAFVKEMPAFGGEVDVFRVLQLLPGVKAASEVSSGLYVRGGSPDQNLVLLDAVTVYNPSHLGGFLSSFHADALRDIKLIKGAFPAEYGGRLSSVIDIAMKEGNAERVKGSGSISLIASGLAVDGPLDSTTTFMVSGRRFYLDVLTALALPADEEVPSYYFYDLNLKINKRLNDRHRIFLSGYFGRDVLASSEFDGDRTDVGWGNSTANLRWTWEAAPEAFLHTSLIFTDYTFGTDLIERQFGSEIATRFASSSRIRDWTARSELQWSVHPDHLIKTGFDVTHHTFLSDVTGDVNDSDFGIVNRGRIEGLDAALYAQDEWTIADNLRTNLGGRLYWFQQGGWLRLEPRANIALDISSVSSVTASFAVAHQFLHLIVRNDIALPTDVWFPSTRNIQPGRSVQGVLGFQTTFDENAYRLTVETYYKDMQNLYEYRDDAEFTLGVPLEDQFTSGVGTAYGIEVFLQKQLGDFTGWLGYTLAWTDRTFAELNNGKTFRPRYDRRHDVSLALQYRLGESWRCGLTWQYATGAAYTVPSGQYVIGEFGSSRDLFTERNGWRLAPFHKMDVNLIHEYSWFGMPWELSINIYNVYNRRNPFAIFITTDFNPATANYERVVKQLTLFPIIPTIGLRFSF